MSRIGKKPIPVPQGVKIAVEGNTVRVEGPKGQLSQRVRRTASRSGSSPMSSRWTGARTIAMCARSMG